MQKFSSLILVVFFVFAEVLVANDVQGDKQETKISEIQENGNKTQNATAIPKKLILIEDKTEKSTHNKASVIKIDAPSKRGNVHADAPHKKPKRKERVKKPKHKSPKKKPAKIIIDTDDENVFDEPEHGSSDEPEARQAPQGSTTAAPSQSQPASSPTSQSQPASSPTSQSQPASNPTSQSQPTSNPTSQSQPTSNPTSQSQPAPGHQQPNQQMSPTQQANPQTSQQGQQMQPNQQAGGNMMQCNQLMSQCNGPYNQMPQSSCGLSCIPNVNTQFSNCMNMMSSCGGGQTQIPMNPVTPPSMCNNLLGLCQQAASTNANQNYMQQCTSLMGQCAPQAYSGSCGSGMTPVSQSCSPVLYGCQSTKNYDFMGSDIWTPPAKPSQLNSMLSDCIEYVQGSCSQSMPPPSISNCQNMMGFCRSMPPNAGDQQTPQMCASLLGNCFPGSSGGSPSSCVPSLSQQQCQSYLSNCMPGQFGVAPSGGNAASANIDQCIALMSQCYPLIQGPQIQSSIGQNTQQDCSALLQYCNCMNSNCDSQPTPIPSVSASDCAALMGTCHSAASHVPGVQGMPAGCAPTYSHCKRSCIFGCPNKCCSSTRSQIPQNHTP